MRGRRDNILTLPDKRALAYDEYGAPDGVPLLLFHGHPGSRRFGQLVDGRARALGIRVVCPDRPGFGLSDFQPGRTLLAWPRDVLALVSALNIDRFAVAGMSAGGPYALACAHEIGGRLSAVGVVSGAGPIDAPGATDGMIARNQFLFKLAGRAPWLATIPMWLLRLAVLRFPGRSRSAMLTSLPPCDRRVLSDPEVMEIGLNDLREAFRRGARGAGWELVMFAQPWGFQLEEITTRVHMWQGDADANVPLAMAQHLFAALPTCETTIYPGEGHLMFVSHMDEILATLCVR